MPIMPPSPSVPEAEAELTKAVALEQEIKEELDQIQVQFTEAEKTSGDRSLAARKAGDQKAIQKINDEVLKLRQQRDVTRSTHEASRQAIRSARHEINQVKGQDLRDQAAELSKQAEERQAKTNQLLTALYEHEGIHYLPEPRSHAGMYLAGTIAENKTAKLAMEAQFLLEQAKITENQIVRVEPDAPVTGRKSNAQPG